MISVVRPSASNGRCRIQAYSGSDWICHWLEWLRVVMQENFVEVSWAVAEVAPNARHGRIPNDVSSR